MKAPHATVQRAATVFIVAVLVNYPWELAQSPLYTEGGNLKGMGWHCFVAALGDGLLVLLVLAAGAAAFHRQDWFERPGLRGYALMGMAGLLVAVLVETVAVHVLGRWSYADEMPRVPGVDIGIIPLLQMLILPPLAFKGATRWLNRP